MSEGHRRWPSDNAHYGNQRGPALGTAASLAARAHVPQGGALARRARSPPPGRINTAAGPAGAPPASWQGRQPHPPHPARWGEVGHGNPERGSSSHRREVRQARPGAAASSRPAAAAHRMAAAGRTSSEDPASAARRNRSRSCGASSRPADADLVSRAETEVRRFFATELADATGAVAAEQIAAVHQDPARFANSFIPPMRDLAALLPPPPPPPPLPLPPQPPVPAGPRSADEPETADEHAARPGIAGTLNAQTVAERYYGRLARRHGVAWSTRDATLHCGNEMVTITGGLELLDVPKMRAQRKCCSFLHPSNPDGWCTQPAMCAAQYNRWREPHGRVAGVSTVMEKTPTLDQLEQTRALTFLLRGRQERDRGAKGGRGRSAMGGRGRGAGIVKRDRGGRGAGKRSRGAGGSDR